MQEIATPLKIIGPKPSEGAIVRWAEVHIEAQRVMRETQGAIYAHFTALAYMAPSKNNPAVYEHAMSMHPKSSNLLEFLETCTYLKQRLREADACAGLFICKTEVFSTESGDATGEMALVFVLHTPQATHARAFKLSEDDVMGDELTGSPITIEEHMHGWLKDEDNKDLN